MTTGMILDIVVILLLVPTIIYAVILNRRLSALRRSREELAKVVNSFNEATMRAEAGIPKLKKATTEANHTLKDRVEKAQTLRDDLAFMIERAEELATRLEGAVRTARSEGVNVPPAQSGTYPAAAGAAAARAVAEPQTPQRTYAAAAAAPVPGTLAQAAGGFEDAAADLRSALGAARAEARVTGPRSMASDAAFPPAKRSSAVRSGGERAVNQNTSLDEDRSEAERELLKALQSAR